MIRRLGLIFLLLLPSMPAPSANLSADEAVAVVPFPGWPEKAGRFKLLVFSKTTGYRHDSIADGLAALRALGARFDFIVEASEDAAVFANEHLDGIAAVVFLSTSGNIFNEAEKAGLQRYVRNGGGIVGIHSATDTEKEWPWFGKMLGAVFDNHPKPQQAHIRRINDRSPSTTSLPDPWIRFDEWYNFRAPPSDEIEILLNLDESTYKGGTMGANHPMAWQHTFEGGRVWYTALGHTPETFREPLFLAHLLGGIQFAAGLGAN